MSILLTNWYLMSDNLIINQNFGIGWGSFLRSFVMEIEFDEIGDIRIVEKEPLTGKLNATDLCRLCASTDNQLMPIFRGEGLEHNISSKIEKHLPIINISESDNLPLQICYQCASTLISWHSLYEGCPIADKRLHKILDKKYQDIPIENDVAHNNNFEPKSLIEENINRLDDFLDDNYDEKFPNTESPKQMISIMPSDNLIANVTTDELVNEERLETVKAQAADISQKKFKNGKLVNRLHVSRFSCAYQYCNKIYTSRRGIIRHVSLDHNSFPVESSWYLHGQFQNECIECHKPFHHEYDVRMHMMRVHEVLDEELVLLNLTIDKDKFKYSCEYCDKRFRRKSNLDLHEKRHNPSPEDFSPCYICGKVLSSRQSMKKHQKIIHKIGIGECRKPNDIYKDMVIVVDGKRLFQCNLCAYLTHLRSRFVEHHRRHTGEKPYTCEHCGKRCVSRNVLTTHLRERHYNRGRRCQYVICDQCGKQLASKANLMLHLRSHTGEKPYACEICGATFARQSTLYLHKMSHQRDHKNKCHVCNKMFVYRSTLKSHLKKHLGKLDFQCKECGKAFVERKYLIRHETVHSDLRPFLCALCGATFKLKKYLTQHARSHIKKPVSAEKDARS